MTGAVTSPSVRLRAPVWARVFVVVFGLTWSGFLISFAVRAPHTDIPVAAAMLVVGILVIGSSLRPGVTATGDQLVIRNHLRATTLTRSALEGFRVGSAPGQGMPFVQCVYALTHEGQVIPLMVTCRPGLRGPSALVRNDLARLQGWLDPTVGTEV